MLNRPVARRWSLGTQALFGQMAYWGIGSSRCSYKMRFGPSMRSRLFKQRSTVCLRIYLAGNCPELFIQETGNATPRCCVFSETRLCPTIRSVVTFAGQVSKYIHPKAESITNL